MTENEMKWVERRHQLFNYMRGDKVLAVVGYWPHQGGWMSICVVDKLTEDTNLNHDSEHLAKEYVESRYNN